MKDSQTDFLNNEHNKAEFIKLLTKYFRAEGVAVIQAEADADTDIVATALREAEFKTVTVAADDTDILVLLIHHHCSQPNSVYLQSQTVNKKTGRCARISIQEVRAKLGEQVCRQLPAIHAVGGCDTTSGIFGIGKGTILKRITDNAGSVDLTDILQDPLATLSDVVNAGLKLLLMIYGAQVDGSLNSLRYTVFCHMSATSLARPKPQKLPPTENAAKYHVMSTSTGSSVGFSEV